MKIQTTFLLAAILLTVFFTSQTYAEYVVIVNPDNSNTLTEKQISDIFMAKAKTYPDGSSAKPLDRPERSPIRVSFINTILGKNEVQFKSYWARLIFTGRAIPPQIVDSDNETKKLVSSDPQYIGIIDKSAVDGTVKVIKIF